MKIWRSIQQIHCNDGIDYRSEREIREDGKWAQCYVTQMDYEGSADGNEAVLVWGKHESTVFAMGYKSAFEAVKVLNTRFPYRKFRLV